MRRSRLIIVCGVPGSGKSTFALQAADRWGAIRFASETFAEQMGAAARTVSGDLSKAAIAHAYEAMEVAVKDAFVTHKLVVAVGSFRSEAQRSQFRDAAIGSGAHVTTLRIVCPIDTAAARIRSRLALGEQGPTKQAIAEIDDALNRATDIDLVLTNDSSIPDLHRRTDAVMQVFAFASYHNVPSAVMLQQFKALASKDPEAIVLGPAAAEQASVLICETTIT